MVALAGAALDTLDVAIGIEGSDDVFAGILAFSTVRFDITAQLWFDVYSKSIGTHIQFIPEGEG